MSERGKLYLIPTPLTDENVNEITDYNKSVVSALSHFIVEDEKTARRFIKRIKPEKDQSSLKIYLLNEHQYANSISETFNLLKAGTDIGLLSDAGCPGIADPGSDYITIAHTIGIRVIPLSGPSSIFLSLMASGFNGQQFTFNGYLPRDSKARQQKISELEKQVMKSGITQIFMETPYRNQSILNDILSTCKNSTRLSIACNITSKNEFISTKEIGAWKKSTPDLNKKPCIFILGK
ncbi:MAG: SAM-dependent methyltransferase [Bacteroidetes bacterium]|nr:MAG: SAM-dependent methyltransferase [Bacteroidota bacterium]REJ99777.1 MAG: SAM-dependent methyltransferase [Bacteroidota bacterium]REK34150.1 MAG: SAM-dependent methyltransferase [Bacteroidota bacterium]REK50480.1 MAG: SAM-dependent methyltransferase [Bacteroidota bacterium]